MSGPAPSIQFAWDGPGTLGAPDDALYMRWNNATSRFEMASVTVPSTLDDLSDVTVTGAAQGAVLYRNASGWVHLPAGTSGQALLSSGVGADPSWGTAGVSDHGGLTGLGDDDHSIYALLAGRAGGQTLSLGLNSGDAGTVNASAHATKGALTLGASQVILPSGTLALPGLRFAVDNDTGIRGVSAGDIRVVANGNDVFQFSASGNSSMSGLSIPATKTFTVTGGLSTFTPANSAGVAVIIKLAASQTANALEIQSSAAAVLTSFGSGGKLAVTAGTNAAPGVAWTVDLASGLYALGVADWACAVGGTEIMRFVRAASVNKIGFFAATPVAKQAFVADPSGGGTVDAESRTAITAVITALENYGLLSTS